MIPEHNNYFINYLFNYDLDRIKKEGINDDFLDKYKKYKVHLQPDYLKDTNSQIDKEIKTFMDKIDKKEIKDIVHFEKRYSNFLGDENKNKISKKIYESIIKNEPTPPLKGKSTLVKRKSSLGKGNSSLEKGNSSLEKGNTSSVNRKSSLGKGNTSSVNQKLSLEKGNTSSVNRKSSLGKGNSSLEKGNTSSVSQKSSLGKGNSSLEPKNTSKKQKNDKVLKEKKKLYKNDLLMVDTLKELEQFNLNQYNNQSRKIIEDKKRQIQNIVKEVKRIKEKRYFSPNQVTNDELSMLLGFSDKMIEKGITKYEGKITQNYRKNLMEEIKNRYIKELFNGFPTMFSGNFYGPDVLEFLKKCILKCLETVGRLNYVNKHGKNNQKIQGNSSRTTSIRNNTSTEQQIVIKGKRSLQYHYKDFLESQDIDTILIGNNRENEVLKITDEIKSQLNQVERHQSLPGGHFETIESKDKKTKKVVFQMNFGDRLSIFECYFGYDFNDWEEIKSFYNPLQPVENEYYKLLFYFQTKSKLKEEYKYYINKYDLELKNKDSKNLYFHRKFTQYINKIREIQGNSIQTQPGTSRENSSL